MPEPGSSDPLGTVQEEADKLVRAASQWWSEHQQAATATAGEQGRPPTASEQGDTGAGGAADHGANGAQTCTGCPWCRARTAIGPIGADTIESVADLLDAAATSLRLFAAARREEAAGVDSDSDSDDSDADSDADDTADDSDANRATGVDDHD